MVVDAFFAVVRAVLGPVISLLPAGNLDVSTTGLADVVSGIAKVNSIIPIAGPMLVALGMLSALGVFLVVRLVLLIWRQVPFT